jgi:uncharacterized protein YukJ
MSLSKGYGVLKCRVIAGKKEFNDNSPHYQVHVSDGRFDYRLAINVKSIQKPYDLLYFIDNNFKHYITDKLEQLDFGFTRIQDKSGVVKVTFNKDFQVSNQGGTISLLNSENIKVDGVSYTK